MIPNLRSLLLYVTGGGVLAALLYVALREEPAAVDLHEVTRGRMEITIDADGETRVRDLFEVAAPIAGTARRAPVRAGDRVTAGETLVAIVEPARPHLLDARTRAQAQATLQEAQAALDVARADLQKAVEDRILAQSQYDRVKALAERNVASLTRLEDATQRLAVAIAGEEAASARVDMSQSTLARAEAALILPEAGTEVPDSCCIRIHAPADGVVLSVVTISERPVQPGDLLVTIGDPQDLELVADLLSSDAVRLAPGARASIERWGGATPLEAVLNRIEPVARTKVSALGIEEQRVDVFFDLVTPKEQRTSLGEGFSVFARIIEWEAEDVLRIPVSALFRDGGGWAAFVAADGRAAVRPLTLGRRNGQVAQVLEGLEPGERVILHPGEAVADGVLITER
ncbi:HlyD family efflux transporter periplasmic adaptor subunit (plasmid) [Leisingera caerulea]|uniref:efflux RND transporter periplasmic adaptor subunit n=1 Tax=Leisingera caerulea TaxID=506591 RepID=UPI0021A60B17|nr:HlyD family efflux transporter periplasmic adaptor subunit [Leisingera caerulea]UWQ52236.1 HlyD family efflux transporter periplasmic adaptor subunit [Leisingera caerulea]